MLKLVITYEKYKDTIHVSQQSQNNQEDTLCFVNIIT